MKPTAKTYLLFLSLSSLVACDPTMVGTLGSDEEAADGRPTAEDSTLSTEEPAPTAFLHCEGDSIAHDTFNTFYATLDLEYPLFDLRLPGMTWSQVGERGCAQIAEDMSQEDLYEVLLSMAKQLDDGRVAITAPDLQREEAAQVTFYPHAQEVAQLDGIAAAAADAPLASAAQDQMRWGMIGSVGYLSIRSMAGLSDSGTEEDDRAAAAAAMTAALTDLAAAQSLIIDARANEGGWDAASLEIAAHIKGEEALAYMIQSRLGEAHDSFAEPQEIVVGPTRETSYSAPVVVLTSGATAGAGETFVLALSQRDNVTLMGERTSGRLSTSMSVSLPNGWSFRFPSHRVIAADQLVYEVAGLPVDIEVQLDASAMESGSDNMLDAALALLADQ